MVRRAERRLSESAGKYRASGAQGAGKFCVVANCAHFMRLLTCNRSPSSLPSFGVINETCWEGMSRRAGKRLPERTGKYLASGGPGRG